MHENHHPSILISATGDNLISLKNAPFLRKQHIALLWLLPAIIWHGLGLAFFINWQDVLTNPPIHYTDYATHYAQTHAVCYFLQSSGQLWGYSPFFHAGFPDGTLFDIDNKIIEVASCGLNRLGISLGHAFNITVLALMAFAPFTVYVAARLVGLGVRGSALAQLVALAFWYGDPTINWMWRGSIISFLVASLGSLTVAAAFWRWAHIASGTEQSSPQQSHRVLIIACVIWFVLGPLLFWLHALSFLILVMPLGIGLIVTWHRMDWRSHMIPFVWSAWVILLNLPWLIPFLRFMHAKTSSTQFLQGGLAQLASEALTFHFALRLVVLGLAVIGFYLWRYRSVQHRMEVFWLSIAVSVASWLAFAYFGVYLGLGDLQPYRFIAPVMMFATLPAVLAITGAWTMSHRHALVLLTALCLAAASMLYRARPSRYLQADGTPGNYLSGPKQDEKEICITLQSLDLQRGRVLVNDFRLGAYLPICSGAQVIGGPFTPVATTYGYTNAGFTTPGVELVLNRPVTETSELEMRAMLAQYNIQWVVVNTSATGNRYMLDDWAREHPGLFEPIAETGAFQLYAVNQPATWFLRGTGRVAAEYNRLHVSDARPGSVVLKYHWIESLGTEPPLPMHPVHVGQDPVPFIAVDNGDVADFAIVQHYD